MSMEQTITVDGMTCANCVRHVREALLEMPGVRAADVDLESGAARLTVDREVPRDAVAAALDDAGYTLR
jgi:copper chaperone CopZ